MSDDDEPSLPQEKTEQELEDRHGLELKEMETKRQAHMEAAKAAAGKGKKAKEKIEAAEREAETWEYKLKTRQQGELELLLEHLGGSGGGESSAKATGYEAKEVAAAAGSPTPEEDEAERARRKKEKAMNKKQNKAGKEAARDAEKEREKREAGPSQRQLELLALTQQLAVLKPAMRIQEVAADGNCLYRSIGEQLGRTGQSRSYEEVRAICAKALRKREDDYAPFAELKEGEDFSAYCNRVESSADWGGHLELRALSDELAARIMVHRAEEKEPLVLGEAAGVLLQVAYHRHYYALGEHYNSVVPRDA